MVQFDLHRSPKGLDSSAPYLLVLQSDLTDALSTVVVAPVRAASKQQPPIGRLQVVIPHAGKPHVLWVQELVSVPRRLLGPKVATWSAHRDDIVAALDLLFTGY